MPARHPVASASPSYLPARSGPAISLPENHPMVVLTRHGGLDRDGDAGREDSREEAEERGGAATRSCERRLGR